jgi:predicted dienelactone hydrolase
MRRLSIVIALVTAAWISAGPAAGAEALSAATLDGRGTYDPSRLPEQAPPAPVDFVVHDGDRDRDVPVRVWLPARVAAAPVIVFSHGLGGSGEGYAFVAAHWAARGYAVVLPTHPGSDTSVWKDVPPAERAAALRGAASLRNFVLRAGDVRAVLDALERWNADPAHPLRGRLDLARVGMAGHSFGAVTTEAVAGESFPVVGTRYTDSRIRAAVVMSPSAPRRGDPADAFGHVEIPWLLMTGTQDTVPIGGQTVESRRRVYPALPPGGKYELVLNDAEHSAFSDRPLPGDRLPRNPQHTRAILAISTAFWDAWLGDDPAARAWLDGTGARSVLVSADAWQRK